MTRAAWAMLVAACVAGVPAYGLTQPQQTSISVGVSTVEGGPTGTGGAITRRGVERYAEALGLTPDQKEAVLALHEGYMASVSEVQRAFAEAMSEIRRSFEESQDPAVFSEKMPKARREQREKMKALERSFLGDIRAILTPEQEQRWFRVERLRRRETQLRGVVSGESVDLTEVIAGLRLGEPDATLREALEDYEAELDRALKVKEGLSEVSEPVLGGGAVDIEAIRERAARQREAGLKVKEVNERHARKLREMLPEEARDRFMQAVRRESFPAVYRPSRAARTIEAAERLEGLSAEQRRRLRELREQYEREAAPLNERWASAIEEHERRGGDSGIMLGDGGVMRMTFGPGEGEGPLAEARRARRELDDRIRQEVERVLTPEQVRQLPRLPEDEAQGRAVQVIRGG